MASFGPIYFSLKGTNMQQLTLYDCLKTERPACFQGPLSFGTDCTGIDAASAALVKMGVDFSYEFASDIDPFAREVIERLHNAPKQIFPDITARNPMDAPYVDVYVAGFPCQAFSGLNGTGQLGLNDKERAPVMQAVLEYIKARTPALFVLENVAAFKRMGLHYLKQEIDSIGLYQLDFKVMSPHTHAGHPQSRTRIFIVGRSREGQFAGRVAWPTRLPAKPARLQELLQVKVSKGPMCRKLCKSAQAVLDLATEEGVLDKDHVPKRGTIVFDMALASFMRKTKHLSFQRDIVPCLHGSSECMYLSNKARYLTWRECFRIQGFDDDFHCEAHLAQHPHKRCYKAAGNSICVPLLARILCVNMNLQQRSVKRQKLIHQ